MKRPVMFAAIVLASAAFVGVPITRATRMAPLEPTSVTTARPTPTPTARVVEFEIVPTLTPEPAPTMEPTPTPEPTPEIAQPFSVAWFSDTQHIIESSAQTFSDMMRWIAGQREEKTIRFVVHTGDIVNGAASDWQWKEAAKGFDLLGDIPFLAIAGNHDVGTENVDYSNFERYIASRYDEETRDLYQHGRGGYGTVEVAENKYLFIGIGWGYRSSSLEWLNRIIASYGDYDVILCLHSYMNENGELTDGGDTIFEQVIVPNPNVKMVLCGHRDTAAVKKTELDDTGDGVADRTVWQLLYDYQNVDSDERAFGALRLLTIDPLENTIKVETYVPATAVSLQEEGEEFTLYDVF